MDVPALQYGVSVLCVRREKVRGRRDEGEGTREKVRGRRYEGEERKKEGTRG